MTPTTRQLLEKVATLPEVIQEEIALQWLDDIENELQWQATLEQPQPKLEQFRRVGERLFACPPFRQFRVGKR